MEYYGLKRSQTKKSWKWPYTKGPYPKPSEKDNYNFVGIQRERMEKKSKIILSGNMCGTKGRWRQRTKYTDSQNNFETRKESPNNELIRRTDDREDWKAMICDVRNRHGT